MPAITKGDILWSIRMILGDDLAIRFQESKTPMHRRMSMAAEYAFVEDNKSSAAHILRQGLLHLEEHGYLPE